MTGSSHYEVLGVARGASARDIRRAYRERALRYHPDVYSGPDAGSRFREIVDAYDVLKDPVERARYDTPSSPHRRGAPAVVWETGRPDRDVPRFLDDSEVSDPEREDLIGSLLRHLLAY